MGDLNTKVDELMERFRKLADSGVQVCLLDEISHLVLDVIGNVRNAINSKPMLNEFDSIYDSIILDGIRFKSR